MTRRLRLAALLPLLALAACRPSEPTDEPPESVQETPLEAAAVADSVAGTYRLHAVNGEPLPGAVGQEDECEVQLSEGRLTLGTDALYSLDVLARAVCGSDEDEEAQMVDRALGEGPFVVEGFEVRFGPEVTRVDEDEDDAAVATEADDLFDTATFAGIGTIRDTLLTVRLSDDFTTLTFAKE